jgi:type IV secretory pathway VirB10-like protein
MRILFLLLLVVNVAFFAWLHFMAPHDPALDPQPMAQQLDPDKLRIVSERELAQIAPAPPGAAAAVAAKAAAPSPEAAAKPAPEPAPPAKPAAEPVSAAKPAPPPEPAPLACIEWGSFSPQEAARAERRLEPLALGSRLAQFRGEETARWWVFIPPQPSRAAAQKKAAELKKLGVEEYFVVQEDGKLRWSVSLGVFRTEEAARARLDALRARGVRSAQLGRRETRVPRLWFQVTSVDAALNARLQELAREFEGATLHDCVARG